MKEKSRKIALIIMIASLLGLGLIGYQSNREVLNEDYAKLEMQGEPPAMKDAGIQMGRPNDFNMPDKQSSERMPESEMTGRNNVFASDGKKLILIGGCSALFSFSALYFWMSRKNKQFYKIKDKAVIYILGNALLITYMTGGMILFTNRSTSMPNGMREQSNVRDKADLDENHVLDIKNIDLSKYSSDVTIVQGGTYTFSGTFHHSIIVNAKDEDVEIILDQVTIETENTAAIIGLAANKITIVTAENTENKLSDGGNSEYDGCIFSNAELIFEGKGQLIVHGNQKEGEGIATEAKNITINSGILIVTSNDDGINAGGNGATITINGGTIYVDASGDGIDSNKNALINGGQLFVMGSDIGGDAGIDTDEGYEIHGGLVVALGSDMIETPKESSGQKTIAFSLNEKIEKDTIVTLMKDEEIIVSFKASKSFKTLIVSSDLITDGNVSLYKGGSNSGTLEYGIYQSGEYTKGNKIVINNMDTFTVSENVNLFGNRRG